MSGRLPTLWSTNDVDHLAGVRIDQDHSVFRQEQLVSPAVIALVPEYRGYDYVVVHEEIVIVEPSTRDRAALANSVQNAFANFAGRRPSQPPFQR